VTTVLADESFIKIVDGFTGGYAKPEIVVLAHGKGFIKASNLIKEVSTEKHGGRANATQG
jgi:purine-nucleoside phosphorylase